MLRVSTGIKELDSMLGGGFVQGDAVMLAGSAGTGKTTLALQYLVNGARDFGENGIYITFEQLPDQICRDASNFGWDLRELEEANKLRVICTSPSLMLEEGAVGETILDEPIREVMPRRLVVDSLNHLSMCVNEGNMRREAYRLIMRLKSKGLSSMLLWEMPQLIGQPFPATDMDLSFLVDSIILLRLVEIESSMRKVLAILKMRGSDHDKKLREFEITSAGVKVMPPFTNYEGIMTGAPHRRVSIRRAVDQFSAALSPARTKD
jgi:circadian clock protein KaiC